MDWLIFSSPSRDNTISSSVSFYIFRKCCFQVLHIVHIAQICNPNKSHIPFRSWLINQSDLRNNFHIIDSLMQPHRVRKLHRYHSGIFTVQFFSMFKFENRRSARRCVNVTREYWKYFRKYFFLIGSVKRTEETNGNLYGCKGSKKELIDEGSEFSFVSEIDC